MGTIKIKDGGIRHHSTFALYVNGAKCHVGGFASLTQLRKFWNAYRGLLCAGWVADLSASIKY